jgi:hypothetical protein
MQNVKIYVFFIILFKRSLAINKCLTEEDNAFVLFIDIQFKAHSFIWL